MFKRTLNKEFLTYLVFVLIAVMTWFFRMLSKEHTVDLKFRASFVDTPADKVLLEAPDKYMSLTVTAQGFTLLKYKMGMVFHPLSINASYRMLKRDSHHLQGEYYILSSSIVREVKEQLGMDIDLVHIVPDTLKFLFGETVQKKVPVKVQAQFQFEKEFLATGALIVRPAEITVSGPGIWVDTLHYVYSVAKTYRNLKDTLKATIALLPSVQHLTYDTREVEITLPVERHTETSLSVPIEAVNLPEGYKMKIFPGTLTITCMVPISRFDRLQPNMFRVTVDYRAVANSAEAMPKAKVSVAKMPAYVSDVRFHPKNVDFIIEK
jgi:YbbR domain-containing protein